MVARTKCVAAFILCTLILACSFSPASADSGSSRIWVPWRSQFDGTLYASSNCGPAALAMAMSYYGEWWSTNHVRRTVNSYMGYWGLDGGSTWEALDYAARLYGFETRGLLEPWSLDELVAATTAGHPVILLVRYWSLPDHSDDSWWGDHYIVFLGLTPDGQVVYHDPAFYDEYWGSYRVMSQERLERAWTRTACGLQHTALSIWPPRW